MSEDLETRARRLAERLSDHAEKQARCLTQTYGGTATWEKRELRDQHADTLAELAEIVRLLVAEVSTQ